MIKLVEQRFSDVVRLDLHILMPVVHACGDAIMLGEFTGERPGTAALQAYLGW